MMTPQKHAIGWPNKREMRDFGVGFVLAAVTVIIFVAALFAVSPPATDKAGMGFLVYMITTIEVMVPLYFICLGSLIYAICKFAKSRFGLMGAVCGGLACRGVYVLGAYLMKIVGEVTT